MNINNKNLRSVTYRRIALPVIGRQGFMEYNFPRGFYVKEQKFDNNYPVNFQKKPSSLERCTLGEQRVLVEPDIKRK